MDWKDYVILVLSVGIIINQTGNYLLNKRNDWLYAECQKLLWSDLNAYERLPSYEDMLFQWWVWDIRKFVQEEEEVEADV